MSLVYFVTYPKMLAPDPKIALPPAGEVTLAGEIVCLSHRKTGGAQTMECAFGLKDQQGRYFGLRDSDSSYATISSAKMGRLVTITGTFTPQEDEKYLSSGIIEVRRID